MTVDVAVATVIERPLAEVSAFVGDPSNAPAWYRRVSTAEWQTEPPIMLGSRIVVRARFLGRDLVYSYQVVEYTPGSQVSMKTDAGPFPMQTTCTWRPLSDRATHMVLRNTGEPTGLWGLLSPLLSFAMRRAMDEDLARLKRLLEDRRRT